MSDSWSYIARTTKPTKNWPEVGSVVCAAVDCPEMQKSNAKEIAKWMRDGLTIERVPVEWVRKFLFTTEPYKPL